MQNPCHLEPADVQLLFADLQTRIVARSKTTEPKALRLAACVLAQLARAFSLPVTISTVPEGEDAPELIPELAKEADGAPQFLRTGASPFLDKKTKMALNSHGRKTLVICGFATEVVVLHAVTGAIEAGYRALVPVDACGGMSERTEAAALRQIEAFGGEVTSTLDRHHGHGPRAGFQDISRPANVRRPSATAPSLGLAVNSSETEG
jgi:hypothetical protein